MIDLYRNNLYMEDVRYVAGLSLLWEKLKRRTIVLSGATGLIGSFLIDVIMEKNTTEGLDCQVIALSRDEKKAQTRFSKHIDDPLLQFVSYDIKKPFVRDDIGCADYVLHLASNTHPLLYSTDPIGTITTNIIGLKNMLDFAVDHQAKRFVFSSSNEIYGENRGDVELFDEEYCGYINPNTVRAGYPESKRCGEALCQAYKVQLGMDVVIPRITRSYGPTMQLDDTKAISQFIMKCIAGEDIVLKSEGNQFFSYTYVADAVSGLLYILLMGQNGEAYNIADEKSDIRLKDLAAIIAKLCEKSVVFELPDEIEKRGYSKATKARLDSSKLKRLGWSSRYDIRMGLERTIQISRDALL